MKVVILGSQGNLGSQLVQVFLNEEVVGLDNVDVNFLNWEQLKTKLENENPELIINTVAYNAVDQCEVEGAERELAIQLNVNLPSFLADFCFARKILLIHYSTDYVFSGTSQNTAFAETDSPNPINFYGQSKADGEKIILDYLTQGLKGYLIRTSKLFGPIGLSAFSKPNFFEIIRSLARSGKIIRSVDEECSCFTYTPDLAEATSKLISSSAVYGVYHLVNEGAATWYEGVLELFRLQKIENDVVPVKSSDFPRSAKRPIFSILKNTKQPKLRSWQEALAEYLIKN
jgi:dTDP-4-dehydrorhamnose reductase